MDERWILDRLLELGSFDSAQEEKIRQLREDMKNLVESLKHTADIARQKRASLWPNVFNAISALTALAAILIALYHH